MRKSQLLIKFCTAMLFTAAVWAGPLDLIKNIGKNVEADPNKEYILTEADGPYFVFVTTFSGQTGRQEANALVIELRKSLKVNAYLYEQTFVHDVQKDFGLIQNPLSKRKPKYLKQGNMQEFAVLVGNFPSLEDKRFKKTLDEIKGYKPASLQNKTSPTPFVKAFGLTNPILPPENPRGLVDPLVERLNSTRPYTLLANPRRYTVQIATFTGRVVISQNEIRAIEEGKKPFSTKKVSELEMSEQAAITLCKVLREQGIEAYEFHDRYASIVTVGSFDTYCQRMPDGTMVMEPLVQEIIQRYQGQPIVSSSVAFASYKPVIVGGIECDIQPKVIEVPRCRRTP